VELSEEVRARLSSEHPFSDEEARSLLGRLTNALEEAEDALAEADVAGAREQADELVAEARRARERILRDLARRRHEARREVAELQAGRDALLEAFAAARGTVDDVTRDMNLALAEARLRAGNARRAVDRQDLPTAADLDAELEMARLAGLPLVAPDTEGPADGEPTEPRDAEGPAAERQHAPIDPEGEAPEPSDSAPDAAARQQEDRDPNGSRTVGAPAEGRGEPTVRLPRTADDQAAPDADREPFADADDVEHRAAQRLKRVLADEQNEVLDRVRKRDKRRTLSADALLGGDLDRIARYRDALVTVLVDASDDPGRAATVAADAAEAIVRGTRARVEALVAEAVDGRSVDEDRVIDGVRACFREWKTQWLVRLAADSVAMAAQEGVADP